MFNVDNGYLEGLCRGFKCGILKQADYLNLVQCETLEGKFYPLILPHSPQLGTPSLGHMTSEQRCYQPALVCVRVSLLANAYVRCVRVCVCVHV